MIGHPNSTNSKCTPGNHRLGRSFLPARENPLAVNRTSDIAFRFVQYDWELHLRRLRDLNFRAAIVGPQGSGKSTLLGELTDRLNAGSVPSHFVFLSQIREQHQPMLREAIKLSKQGHVLLVDGIERLSFFQRRNLIKRTRNSAGLIVTQHHTGKLPTWIKTETTPELMTAVLFDLKLEQPEILSAGEIAFAKHNGNIRNALRDLYDQCASGGFNDILCRPRAGLLS